MSFAVRPIGLAKGMRWEFVGAGALSTTTTVNFPATAQAGDLAVFCTSVSSSGSPPSGWTPLVSGSNSKCYLVCAGGETSATWTRSVTSNACILLFRPVGGAATLYADASDWPPANRTMSAGASPSLIVAIGNTIYPATWSPTLPGSWSMAQNIDTAPALYVAWRLMEPSESTGTMNLGVGNSARQTFGIWGIT